MNSTKQTETKQSKPQRESREFRESVEYDESGQSWAGPTHPLLQLQQTIGNRAVGQMLRADQGQPVQRLTAPGGQAGPQIVQRQATSPTKNKSGLPDNLKSGIENLSGISMDDVKVHYNSPRPKNLQALAYTQGTDIQVAPGQQKHLPHEAWHVVQQKQGRVKPTLQFKDVSLNDDSGLEREADVMGEKAAQGPSELPKVFSSQPASVAVPFATQDKEVVQGKFYDNLGHPISLEDIRKKAAMWPSDLKVLEKLREFDKDDVRYIEVNLEDPEELDKVVYAFKTGDFDKVQVRVEEEEEEEESSSEYESEEEEEDEDIHMPSLKEMTAQAKKRKRQVERQKKFRKPIEKWEGKELVLVSNDPQPLQWDPYADYKPPSLPYIDPSKPYVDVARRRKPLRKEVEAKSPAEGMTWLGSVLDKMIPYPGDQISLALTFKIPIPAAPGVYILVKLSGTAGRGISGFSTSGYAQIAKDNPQHLEVSGTFNIGAGFSFEAFKLLKIDLSASFKVFARSGAHTTAAAMQALSYGVYRALSTDSTRPALSKLLIKDTPGKYLANWWKGGGIKEFQKAEEWAAKTEQTVLAAQEGFADIGWGLEGGGSVEALGGYLGAEVTGGFESFRRYDKEALEKSLGQGKFGVEPKSPKAAKSRQKEAAGAKVRSFSAGYSTTVAGFTFGGALSAERRGENSPFKDNIGFVFSGEISSFGDQSEAVEKLLGSIIGSGLSAIQKIKKFLDPPKEKKKKKKDEEEGAQMIKGIEALADGWSVFNGVQSLVAGDMTENLMGIADASVIVSIAFGFADGKPCWRIDVQQAKGIETPDFWVQFEFKKVGRIVSFYNESGEKLSKFKKIKKKGLSF